LYEWSEQGDTLLSLLFNFDAIRIIQANQVGSKLNGTYQILVYADNINMLFRNTHTIKKNTDTLVVPSKGTGLEVNAANTKCLETSMQDKITTSGLIINSLKEWNSSNI
jgi:hypothetical protein